MIKFLLPKEFFSVSSLWKAPKPQTGGAHPFILSLILSEF